MSNGYKGPLEPLDEYRWRIPPTYRPGMRVPGLIFADHRLVEQIRQDRAPEQVANVATLPGIIGWSLAMPDIHWGYGFPIGGVAAMDLEDGVISPGGVGYDINCGVRLLRTNLGRADVSDRIDDLMGRLYARVPSGVGSSGPVRLSGGEMDTVLGQGARFAVERGFGHPDDLEFVEEGGAMAGARPRVVSAKAKKRGRDQLGTLGSGNHFLEVDVVDRVYDEVVARTFGLERDQVVVLIHSGSRGLGHQVCTDYVRIIGGATQRHGIELPDRQLACAPINSTEGRDYFAAMACACNYAWANRQYLTHWTREVFAEAFGATPARLGLTLLYDQAHNIAKFEEHAVEGKRRRVCVHRKGASRAFGPGRAELPGAYRDIGQPVLVPGDMGTASYVLVGRPAGLEQTWGSACHGAGRTMSRGAAKRQIQGKALRARLAEQGISVRAPGDAALAEEAPDAYKDIDLVVDITHASGIAGRVVRLRPLGVMKG